MLLANIVKPSKAWKLFKMGCYAMMTLITLQSVFTLLDRSVSIQGNGLLADYYHQFNTVVTELVAENKAAFEQKTNQDECVDCSKKCCPCCLNFILTLVSIKADIKMPELLFYGIESTKIDSPYYSLLRPPKHLGIYLS
jgi:hypothetical protein